MEADLKGEQARDWQLLHDGVTQIFDGYGVKDPFGKGDYWLLDENWGRHSQQIEFMNLDLFQPVIISALQGLLEQFLDWYITIRVAVPGKEDEWPGMGVIIYRDRIIDDLNRDFLPARFRNVIFGTIAADEAAQSADRVRHLMAATQAKRSC